MGAGNDDKTDYVALQKSIGDASQQQLRNNRLNTSNPFASQTFNEDGSVSQQFAGGLGQTADSLMGQAGGMGQPMDWSQFGQAGNGDQARDQAVNASYGQMTSRLDPQWDKREQMMGAKLLNQGLDQNSQAYKDAMTQFGQQRNDAYQGAMNSAVGMGQSAGDSVFRNNMTSRQQAISEALQKRVMPLSELKQLQGFLGGQPQYNADGSSLSGALGSAGIAQNAAQQKQQEADAANASTANTAAGIMSGIGTAAGVAAMFF